MKFPFRFGRKSQQPEFDPEDTPFTIADAQERVKMLCENLARFHLCISESYQAFTKFCKEEGITPSPHSAEAHFQGVGPALSVHLLEPLREYEKCTAGGRQFGYGDVAGVFAVGGKVRDCLPVADDLLKSIAGRMAKYRPGDPNYSELADISEKLLAQRLFFGGKPKHDVVSAMARGFERGVYETQLLVDQNYRHEMLETGGKPQFDFVEQFSKGPQPPGRP